ncbi:TPA: acyltransferase [Streptococcus suis]|nr:acyltransferase [Streptococcus suis]
MKKKLDLIILIRVFAILSVVLGHSTIAYSGIWDSFDMKNHSKFLVLLHYYIDLYQMPLFISVSGYLFYYLRIEKSKYLDFGKFIVDKAKRLLIPFVIVGLFFMIPVRSIGTYSAYQNRSYFSLVKDLFLNINSGNLWFLPVLFFIFIIMWIISSVYIKQDTKERTVSDIVLFLVLIFVSILSSKLPSILFISLTANYLFFFFLGFIIRKYQAILLDNTKNLTMLLILSFILQFSNLIFKVLLPIDGTLLHLIFIGVSILGSIFSVLFFYCIFTFVERAFINLTDKKIVKSIDSDSFGIYLFHASIIFPILSYYQNINVSPYYVSIILFVVSLLVSWLLTIILSKFKYTKYIVGK